jgi:hypothetical protein
MNSLDARMVFDNARAAMAKAFPGADISRYVLTMSTLRLEQALVAGQNLYTFPVLNQDTVGGVFNTEIRLKQQDSFFISHIAFYLGLPSSTTDTAWLPLTYESPALSGPSAVPLRALWNGVLTMTLGNYKYVYNWDLLRHYYAPQTQQTSALGAGSPTDQKRLLEDSFSALEPMVTLMGTEDNQIQIQLDAPPSSFPANARIGLLLRGVNAQNSTPVAR